jgi:hypothetical protein
MDSTKEKERHMSDKLFGLAGLGLDDLENMNIYGQKKRRQQPRPKK